MKCLNIYADDWATIFIKFQKQPPEVFCKKMCSQKSRNIHRKILVLKSFLIKLKAFRPPAPIYSTHSEDHLRRTACKNCFGLWGTVCQWWMLKNHWNTLKICLFGKTRKQRLSNFEPLKSWKYKQLWGLGPKARQIVY